ncbi:MAG: hypothetical protein ACREJO_06960 [Phycisphaerales bacterium]
MVEDLRQIEFRAMAVLLRIGESDGASIKEARLAATAVLKSCERISARDFPAALSRSARSGPAEQVRSRPTASESSTPTGTPPTPSPSLREGAGGKASGTAPVQVTPAPQAPRHSAPVAPAATTVSITAASPAPATAAPSAPSAPAPASTTPRPAATKAPASSLPSEFGFLSSLLAPIAPIDLSPSSTSAALISAAGVPTALTQPRQISPNTSRAA